METAKEKPAKSSDDNGVVEKNAVEMSAAETDTVETDVIEKSDAEKAKAKADPPTQQPIAKPEAAPAAGNEPPRVATPPTAPASPAADRKEPATHAKDTAPVKQTMSAKAVEPAKPAEAKVAEAAKPQEKESFAEVALRLGGKGEEETRRTGAVDRADEQVEAMFAQRYQTANSPVHKAIWDGRIDPIEFFGGQSDMPLEVEKVMVNSIDTVQRHRAAGTLLDQNHKISEAALRDLAAAGYWGLLVDKKYGGAQAPFATFAKFLTRMAMYDPTVAGLASVHGCIGAVDPLQTFGSPEQKQRFLPKLASGERLSAFALTEPGAGSDLTALRTTARRSGGDYVVNGEKLFITNVVPGRTIGLVCLIDDKPAVLIVDLPPQENEQFQLKKYGLYALRQTWNQGIIFRDFHVPEANLLRPVGGDGLTIAYHGLNRGRVSLCANASGAMRLMMASIIPWARFRKTYGQPIASRELVQRRLGRLAGLVVGCDALVDWCGWLLDSGFRGEMECIIAKIFGSEAQKTAAIEYFMKTHGGRSFLHGHMFGDNVHEYLAPCIYEGEGEMLGMAFFKSLVKQHGVQYFQPVAEVLKRAGLKQPSMTNPVHLWKLRGPGSRYARWWLAHRLIWKPRVQWPYMPAPLREHADWAAHWLQRSPREISGAMMKHQLKLTDRQCRIAEISQRVQDAVVVLCTSLYASRQEDEIVRTAADVLCQDLRQKLTGERPSDRYFRTVTKLGEAIAEGQFKSIAGLEPDEILMPY
jgi:alkylation response protein AidB-like acyl-CoA dehydrogenase